MNIRHLTFRLLQVYVEVIQTGSISESAKRLHLTQPTVSLQLKRLKEAIGEPLFVLEQNQVIPTDAGRELYRICLQTLGDFSEFNQYLGALQDGQRGHFSIAMVNTAQYILPRLLGPYAQAFSKVEVTVEIGNREQVLRRFEQGQDDLYVFSHPPSLEHACAGRFLRNPLTLIAPASHPLATKKELALADVMKERFLLREPGSATRMLFESWLQGKGLTLASSMQMASNEAIRVGVSSGMGLAVLSRHVLPKQDSSIVTLDVPGLPIESHWYFIARNDRHLSQAALGFLRFAERELDNCLGKEWVRNDIGALLSALTAQS
ncbi:LysR family transcriptional regulator [Pseudoalteromonas tunicata]|uniref:LysR family transcriptional regulator n=1 Tax=Pseudoalteromonas tunicata TaxID=314281 RepID=UPI00273D6148|nr:LysR family transcriptional regulator [Pseudoalteromonas tunicata]MDP4984960.1 LysR family transcriptional regulator [Pseudoalteromonas tunicata]MDP5212521.1 LysR family transcriptional regulator [Pseudoalteromonas tunicata]